MKRLQLVFLFMIGLTAFSYALSPLDRNKPVDNNSQIDLRAGDCVQAAEQIDLAVNNVRARILGGGGDLWRERPGNGDASYVIPKVPEGELGVSSIFAGGVWLGGLSEGGALLVAAVLYRDGSNNDFYSGPLDPDGTIEKETCDDWDKFFVVHGKDIKLHYKEWQICQSTPGCEYSADGLNEEIRGWPAFGNEEFEGIHGFALPEDSETMATGLAPFHDEDQNGLYDPAEGDYPIIQVRGCEEKYYADEMIFYIYNDNGNTHTQSDADAIKMEIQAEVFAWKKNDEINDMTFYRYKMINRAAVVLDSTYFGMFADIDLGCSEDDYIGVDVGRSLAYAYNNDDVDGTSGCACPSPNGGSTPTYCDEIPMIGLDYFRGPLGPFVYDSTAMEYVSAPLGTAPDTIFELGMTSFVYFIRDGDPGRQDPTNGPEFYNYLTGSWRDGTPITFGGTGYNLGSEDRIPYVFPSDPSDQDPNAWSMVSANQPAEDARTLQASGPFVLSPGDKNELIIGIPWVPNIPHPIPALDAIRAADDIAQALFDNCFEIVDGPDAPDVAWIEMDNKLIAIMSNNQTSNNFEEAYAARNLTTPNVADSLHVFEGYIIYQKRVSTISNSDLNNFDEARPVFQCDIKNGAKNLYNWLPSLNPNTNELLWFPTEQVEAQDKGVVHTFTIERDMFGGRLINHKKYHYAAFAYAYNQFEAYDPQNNLGQKIEFLPGRNFTEYTVTPHKVVDRTLNSDYGDGPVITRFDGVGIGDNFVAIEDGIGESIVNGTFDGEIKYKKGRGPIDVKVVNPLDIVDGDYILRMVEGSDNGGQFEVSNNSKWELIENGDFDNPIASEKTIELINEQVVAQRGFSISIGQTGEAGDGSDTDGAVGASIESEDGNRPWISMLEPNSFGPVYTPINDDYNGSPLGNMAGFSAYKYCECRTSAAQFYTSPAAINAICNLATNSNDIEDLNNVDIVMTSDKSLWSRCIIVESANTFYSGTGVIGSNEDGNPNSKSNPIQFDLRQNLAVGKNDSNGDGLPDPDGSVDDDGDAIYGMGWFPGYAFDVESGMRLNVFFGENSAFNPGMTPVLAVANPKGADMMFNPDPQVLSDSIQSQVNPLTVYLGGHHFVYVTDTEYDECEYLRGRFSTSLNKKKKGLQQIKWAGLPLLNPEYEMLSYANGLIPKEVRVSLRVSNPYGNAIGTNEREGESNEALPYYTFKFEGVATESLVDETANDALDLVNVVPNPYNAYSAYETNEIDGRIKITNLPNECTVSIYSLDGRFIRQFKRNLGPNFSQDVLKSQGSVESEIEWDLKNAKGIPVASGMYLIHIDAPGVGQRTLKWFGAMRQFDPSKL